MNGRSQDINKLKYTNKTNYILYFLGFVMLSLITGLLVTLAFYQSTQSNFYILIGIILISLFLQYVNETKTFISQKYSETIISIKNALIFISLVAAALMTFFLSNELMLGPVVASALIGIIAALFFPKYAVPIYCGSFVGMASPLLLNNYISVLLSAIIAGIVFIIGQKSFNGFGGKLGTTAFLGCTLLTLLRGADFVSSSVPSLKLGLFIIIYSVLATVLTSVISIKLKHGAVMASAIIGLIGGLILPVVHHDFGNTLAIVVFCASFTGMTSKERLKSKTQIFVAGIITGIIFIFSSPFFGGAGGKLGTIAFAANISTAGIYKLFSGKILYKKK